MASEIDYCDLCLGKHITKAAERFCPQCDEKLCISCTEHHRLSKATQTHQILSINEYKGLPPFIREINQYCEEHGDILEFYCGMHDDVCCKRCMTSSHKHCKDVEVIEDILKTSSSSTALDKFDRTLQDIERNVDIVMSSKEHNLHELEKIKVNILKLVKEKKKEIIKHLDELEKSFQRDLSDIERKNRQKIGSLIQELAAKRSEANTLRNDIAKMKKQASNLQIFLGTRKLEEPVLKLRKYCQSFSDNGGLNNTNIECKFNDKLLHFTTNVKEFGSLKQKYDETTCSLSWQEEKAAQIFTMKEKTIGDIIIKKKQQINTQEKDITGCTMMKDGCALFTGTVQFPKGMVSKYNSNGHFVSHVVLNTLPVFDIEPVNESSAIVTGGGYGNILNFVDTNTLRIKNTINTGDHSYGVTYHDGDVISCTSSNGIGRISLSSKAYTQLIPTYSFGTYITSDNNYIYHSDYHTNSVVCYDFNGHTKWTYKDEALNGPRSITIDSSSNVYVAGCGSNNVVVISPGGKQGRQLLGPSDGLENPKAIFYDKERNCLLIANCNGPSFIYDVS